MDDLIKAVKECYFSWNTFSVVSDTVSKFCAQASAVQLERFQDSLLDVLVLGTFAQEHPIHPGLSTKFFKSLVLLLETHGAEVHEKMYESVVIPMTAATASSKPNLKVPAQKSYFRQNSHLCSLIESRDLISDGTTGLRTWEAARVLTGHILGNPDLIVKDSSVVELGAGLGFVGISLLKSNFVRRAVLTDFHPKVLEMLAANGRINFPDMDDDSAAGEEYLELKEREEGRSLTVSHWDWEADAIPNSVAALRPDTVLAADVVFDPSILPFLVKSIKTSLTLFASRAIIACTVRNPETLDKFRHHLHQEDFNVKETDISFEEDKSEVIAFTITLK